MTSRTSRTSIDGAPRALVAFGSIARAAARDAGRNVAADPSRSGRHAHRRTARALSAGSDTECKPQYNMTSNLAPRGASRSLRLRLRLAPARAIAGWIARLALAVTAWACGACAKPAEAPATPPMVSAIRYDAHVAASAPAVVDVVATFRSGAADLIAEVPDGVRHVVVDDGKGPRRVVGRGGRYPLRCFATCVVRYRYDLAAAAAATGDAFDTAVRRGGAVMAPAWVWLLRPEPLRPDIPIDLRVGAQAPVRFASGLRPTAEPGRYALASQELVAAGYTAFGRFDVQRVQVKGGVVDVAILGELPNVDAELVARWIEDSSASLNDVFGRFPVDRVMLFLVGVPGASDVRFGRTLPSGGSSIALAMGSDATAADLYADWVLVHELFHLGVPSFLREGRWFDEGLATYYEPVVRTRAGLITRHKLWAELAEGLPRGLPEPGDPGLLTTTDGSRIYWGGAAFVLQADVLIRERTGGARSLDDGLRAALARGGDATRLWSLRDYLRAIDEGVGVPVLTELYSCLLVEEARRKRAPATPPAGANGVCPPADAKRLTSLLADLGIAMAPNGAIALRADAPLAHVRERIERPRTPAASGSGAGAMQRRGPRSAPVDASAPSRLPGPSATLRGGTFATVGPEGRLLEAGAAPPARAGTPHRPGAHGRRAPTAPAAAAADEKPGASPRSPRAGGAPSTTLDPP